jgi:hypothetical protein
LVSLKPHGKRAGRWMRSRHAHASGVHATRSQLPGVRVMVMGRTGVREILKALSEWMHMQSLRERE